MCPIQTQSPTPSLNSGICQAQTRRSVVCIDPVARAYAFAPAPMVQHVIVSTSTPFPLESRTGNEGLFDRRLLLVSWRFTLLLPAASRLSFIHRLYRNLLYADRVTSSVARYFRNSYMEGNFPFFGFFNIFVIFPCFFSVSAPGARRRPGFPRQQGTRRHRAGRITRSGGCPHHFLKMGILIYRFSRPMKKSSHAMAVAAMISRAITTSRPQRQPAATRSMLISR